MSLTLSVCEWRNGGKIGPHLQTLISELAERIGRIAGDNR